MAKVAYIALAGILATSMLAAPAVFAEEGSTAKGGTPAANAGSSSDKSDKKMQDNSMSADKDKQHK